MSARLRPATSARGARPAGPAQRPAAGATAGVKAYVAGQRNSSRDLIWNYLEIQESADNPAQTVSLIFY